MRFEKEPVIVRRGIWLPAQLIENVFSLSLEGRESVLSPLDFYGHTCKALGATSLQLTVEDDNFTKVHLSGPHGEPELVDIQVLNPQRLSNNTDQTPVFCGASFYQRTTETGQIEVQFRPTQMVRSPYALTH